MIAIIKDFQLIHKVNHKDFQLILKAKLKDFQFIKTLIEHIKIHFIQIVSDYNRTKP